MHIREKQRLFEETYTELFPALYRHVGFRVPHRQDAEDIVSTVLLNAYQKIHQWDETKGTLIQWIRGIATLSVIDHWRQRKFTVDLDEVVNICESFQRGDDPSRLDQEQAFEELMKALSPEHRALFALRYIDGFTCEEIAVIVEKESPAIRAFFSRTHRKLAATYSHLFSLLS